MLDPLPVAVVLSTRGRPEGAARTARSILASDYPSFELRIVDQSGDTSTREALEALPDDPRLTVLPTSTHGLAAARNAGTASTGHPIVAFTDDDCEVASDWLAAIAAPFSGDPSVGVVFGEVAAARYDRRLGLIPALRIVRPRTVRSLSRPESIDGMGACMAVRRTTWEALRGFDESLGAGTTLCSAEETDFALRTLVAGRTVYATPAARVTHTGFRAWPEAHATLAGYMVGLGAVHAKMLRLAGPRAARVSGGLAWRWALGSPAVDLNGRPPRLPRLQAFLHGARIGLRTPLDRESGHFRPR